MKFILLVLPCITLGELIIVSRDASITRDLCGSVRTLTQDCSDDSVDEGEKTDIDYGQHGDDWCTCDGKENQSPINLPETNTVTGTEEQITIISPPFGSNVTVEMSTSGILANSDDFLSTNKVQYNGNTYALLQMHFHSHAEHTYNTTSSSDVRDVLEAHFVFVQEINGVPSDDPALVMGIIYSNVSSNDNTTERTFLTDLLGEIAQESGAHTEQGVTGVFEWPSTRELGFVGSAFSTIQSSRGWTYPGSLTTPPCAAGLSWFVFQDNLTTEELDLVQDFTELEPGNYRNTQDIAEREVKPVIMSIQTEDTTGGASAAVAITLVACVGLYAASL